MKFEHEYIRCPYCGSTDVIFDPDTHEYVCRSCGSVIADRVIDRGYEYRLYDNRQILPRTSGSHTSRIHDMGIGDTGPKGRFRSDKWRKIKRAQKNTRVNKKERIIEKSLKHLNDLIRLLNPPDYVSETAAQILRRTVEGSNYKDKTLRAIAAASIYLAYKINGIPKSIRMFSNDVGISQDKLWRADRIIHDKITDINKMIKRDDPTFFIPYLTVKLDLSDKVKYLANYLSSLAVKNGLTNGKSALGIATAAVYIASILLDEKRTQIEIAEKVGVTDVTIRNRYDDIIKHFDIEIEI